jgi:hypothetical protein
MAGGGNDMDGSRFDSMTRLLAGTSPRRSVLLGLASAVLGLSGARRPNGASAKKSKRLERNAFGCVNVGGTCRGRDKNCCSGRCQGKKPKKGERDRSRCVAHDEDTCKKGQNLTGCGGQTVHCTTSTGGTGACRTTTGNAGYCSGDGQCRRCRKDADCRPFCGPKAACVVCDSPLCEVGTLCVGPTDDGCIVPPS